MNDHSRVVAVTCIAVIIVMVAVQFHTSSKNTITMKNQHHLRNLQEQEQQQQQPMLQINHQVLEEEKEEEPLPVFLQPPPGIFSFCNDYPKRCQALSGFLSSSSKTLISFTHISKCGGVSWIRELKRLAARRVVPQGEAGPEYSISYQNDLLQEKRHTTVEEDNNNNNNNELLLVEAYRLVVFRNPREHLYSQFRHCAYSDFGRGYSKVFPRENQNNPMIDFEIWLDHYWNETTTTTPSSDKNMVVLSQPQEHQQEQQHLVLSQSPYRCYHPVNMQTRFLTMHHKNPAVLPDIPRTFEDDFNLALLNYWNQYDFVGLLEFQKESKCLLFHRILLAEEQAGGGEGKDESDLKLVLPAMKEYLQDSCTCQEKQQQQHSEATTSTSTRKNNAFNDIHFDHSSQGAAAKDNDETKNGFQVPFDANKMDRLTRADRALYTLALKQFLREMVRMESQLERRILCDDALAKQEPSLAYLGLSVTDDYHDLRRALHEEQQREKEEEEEEVSAMLLKIQYPLLERN